MYNIMLYRFNAQNVRHYNGVQTGTKNVRQTVKGLQESPAITNNPRNASPSVTRFSKNREASCDP